MKPQMILKPQKFRNPLLLFTAALIWGTAFVAQRVGLEYVGPFTLNCVRSLIGGLVLIPVIVLFKKKDGNARSSAPDSQKALVTGGVLCGVILCVASNAQQIGIGYTSVGKAGFITAFYIVLVPLLGIFFHKRIAAVVWLGVAMALLGLYFLCIPAGGFTVSYGDLLCLIGACVFSLHILAIDHFSPLVDGVKMSCIQFFVCGALSAIPMLILEHPAVASILRAYIPILYAGVLSSGVAYTLQIIGQKDMNPAVASLILSLESVISALAGWAILGQALSLREMFGCIIMFAAVTLVQRFGREPSAA